MSFLPDLHILIIMTVPLLAAVTVHEVAHGWVAYLLGDPTARNAGRLTFNPIKHLDLFGTLAFIFTQVIGWAKPVPVNPQNLRHPKRDMIWVALAGPAANFALAVVCALLLHLLPYLLSVFALLGHKVMVFFGKPLFLMLNLGIQLNLGLAVFNLLPVPPLDGGRIVAGILPLNLAYRYARLEPYGVLIVLLLIFTGVIQKIILPAILYLSDLLRGGML